jgi:hypothetical protein
MLSIALGLFGPDSYEKEAEFRCMPDYKVEAVYPDMVLCSNAMTSSAERGCGCSRAENPWARWYFNYLVPLAIGLVAWLLFLGSTATRIGFLNAGFWAAILLSGVYDAFTNPEGVEGLVLSIGHLIYVATVASVVLAALDLLARRVSSYRQGA